MIAFEKYHGLGNDYLVVDDRSGEGLTTEVVRRVCDRSLGVGSDGILLRGSGSSDALFTLRIFNPDGSEAEKSGNGLRIFARYLFDRGEVGVDAFASPSRSPRTSRSSSRDPWYTWRRARFRTRRSSPVALGQTPRRARSVGS